MSHLHLTEYKPITLPAEAIPYEVGEEIHQRYSRYIEITFPSPRTNGRWQLVALGWVGHIPLSHDWQLTIHTKVPTHNIWEILSWVYDWHTWRLFEGTVQTDALPAFYDGLAQLLAERVLLLARQGLWGAYQPQQTRQTAVRGRIKLAETLQNPTAVGLVCAYEQHTHDNLHNQILALTLQQIGRSGWCTAATGRAIRHARQAIPLPTPHTPIDWPALTYTRLNEAYRPLHALCKFFLDGLLPSLQSGRHTAIPFLINMSLLYEQFVAQWLTHHMPSGYRLRAQERVTLSGTNGRQIAIDLVLYNPNGQATAVLDTKYKAPDRPDMADIYQVAFYAHQQNCAAAYLVYPTDLAQPLSGTNRDVHYRNLTFPLAGDLADNGRLFLEALLHHDR